MEIVSLREHPERVDAFVTYFVSHWGQEAVYRDCMLSCLDSMSPLPQWYILLDGEKIAGGVGLISNDFISRMDLWPWLCALYIEEPYRGRALGSLLIAHAEREAGRLGFSELFLCTAHVGYYEKYGFSRIGTGYHPWNESSSIFRISLPKPDEVRRRGSEC